MSFCSLISLLVGCPVCKRRIACCSVSFMESRIIFEKIEMGIVCEKWIKAGLEVGQMGPSVSSIPLLSACLINQLYFESANASAVWEYHSRAKEGGCSSTRSIAGPNKAVAVQSRS